MTRDRVVENCLVYRQQKTNKDLSELKAKDILVLIILP